MRRGPASCVLLAALSASCQAVWASGEADAQAVQATAAYARQHMWADKLAQAALETDQNLGLHADCKEASQPVPMSMQVVRPAEFVDGKADPVKGSWLVRYRLDRCGDAKIYNAVYLAHDGSPPTVHPSFPGTTLANPTLLLDAMRSANLLAGATGMPKDCSKTYVFDMQVVDAPHDVTDGGKTFKGAWNERWTFSQCGKLIDVSMLFRPSPEGGVDFRASAGPVRPEPPAS